jgi:hypothetical protein
MEEFNELSEDLMVFVSFLIAFLLFVYAALAPVLDYTINADFHVVEWGLVFLALGFLVPQSVVAAATYRNREVR